MGRGKERAQKLELLERQGNGITDPHAPVPLTKDDVWRLRSIELAGVSLIYRAVTVRNRGHRGASVLRVHRLEAAWVSGNQ